MKHVSNKSYFVKNKLIVAQLCRRPVRDILILLKKKKLLFYTNIYCVVSKDEGLEDFDLNDSAWWRDFPCVELCSTAIVPILILKSNTTGGQIWTMAISDDFKFKRYIRSIVFSSFPPSILFLELTPNYTSGYRTVE